MDIKRKEFLTLGGLSVGAMTLAMTCCLGPRISGSAQTSSRTTD